MATYAAYRHVELDKIGYGKRRVLKPPGGGTSDLFTVANGEEEKIRIAENLSAINPEPSASNGTMKNDGNPVTGEGYDLAKSASQNNAAAPAAPSKARVPPGGYSSGLW